LALILTLGACPNPASSDEDSDIPTELVGTWQSSITGEELFEIKANGDFILIGNTGNPQTYAASVDNGTVTVSMNGTPIGTFSYSISNGAMTMSNATSIFVALVNSGPFDRSDPGGTPAVSGVTVSPATPGIVKGQTLPFAATVQGTNNPAQTVTWSVLGGGSGTTISSAGVLTVAAGESAASLTVRAASTLDPSKYGTATVTVTGGGSTGVVPGGGSTGVVPVIINFEEPAEDITIEDSTIISDPYYDPSIPVLANGQWQDGSNPVKYHQFYAWAGTSYSINWNDSDRGDGSKTADIGVSAYWKADNYSILSRTDSGWDSSSTFIADRSGIVILKVESNSGGNTYGTYAVKYNAAGSNSLVLSVANAGDYSNFQWILDGALLPGETGSSITIVTGLLDRGPHRLTLIAVKAGKSYSREVKFQVNE
jgi:hypothetical protein